MSGGTVATMTGRHPTPGERDERVQLPLDPEVALQALLAVKPEEPECGRTNRRDDDDQHRQG